MGIYERYILPPLIDLSCGTGPIRKQRAKVVPLARGRVLEVGMGTGHNLEFYDAQNVEVVFGLEPSAGMRVKAEKNLAASPVPVEWVDLPGERVPLPDNSVDTVVLTFTLCTIADYEGALAQMRRVLKPGGQLLFCEHGQAPDQAVQRMQDRINPLWKRLAGGCHVNRPIPRYIEQAGFDIQAIETMYLPGTPRFAGFNYWGNAT